MNWVIIVIQILLVLVPDCKPIELCPESCDCDDITHSTTCKYLNPATVLPGDSLKINVSHANIPVLMPIAFTSMNKIQFMHFTNCQIKNLADETFRKLHSLKVLDLSYNRLTSVKHQLAYLIELQVLNVSYNAIKDISETAFIQLRELKVLDLSNNKLEQFPIALLKNVKMIEILNLHGNQLTSVHPYSFVGLQSLKELYLSSNRLKTIHNVLLQNLTELQTVGLSHNPFDCNCALKWLWHYLNEGKFNFENSSSIECASPIKLRSKPIESIFQSNLSCIAPTIEFTTENVEVKVTGDIHLLCNVTGYPRPLIVWRAPWGEVLAHPDRLMWLPPKLVWLHYKTTLSVNTEPTWEISQAVALEDGTLKIKRIRTLFVGQYVCIAINPGGTVSANITVKMMSSLTDTYVTSLWIGASSAGVLIVIALLNGVIRLCCNHCRCACCRQKSNLGSIYSQSSIVNAYGSPWLTPSGTSPSLCKSYTPVQLQTSSDNEVDSDDDSDTANRSFEGSSSGLFLTANIKESLDEVRVKLREHVDKKKEEMRKRMQRVRESGSHYMQTIRESSSQAANRVKAGVVLGVEHVKYHVRSIKEFCGTGDIGQTISTVSIATNVDSSVETAIEKKHTFV